MPSITVPSSLIPNAADTPLDARIRVNLESDIPNIQVPYVGMLIFCKGDNKYYIVTAVKDIMIGNLTVTGGGVDTYEEYTQNAATIEVGVVTTGAEGSQASVNNTGTSQHAVFDFNIPKGDKGDAFTIDAAGSLADRTLYDDEAMLFIFLDIDNGNIYIKESAASGDWSGAIAFKGDQGIQGVDGDSAYQVWLDEGNTGDRAAFLLSLKGDKGDKGVDGVSIFQQDITPLTGTPVSVSAGGVYSWTISAASVINKGTWADDGLEYAVMLITVEAGGSVTGGTGITLVDALRAGFNYCILRGINGAVDLLISPE